MTDRYFVETPITSDRATLSGAEAHHLLHVLRAKAGVQLVLFDGSGAEFAARVERIDRTQVELAVLSRAGVDRELPLELILAVALPKGERQRWLVEKAVELGVTRLIPLETARGVAQPVENALARLRRAVIEASKQCGRNRLLQVSAPQSWPEVARQPAPSGCLRAVLQPGASASVPESLDSIRRGVDPSSLQFAIGPEGGFTDDEVALATAAGWQVLSLGPRVLRVETAAIAIAVLAGECGRR